MFWEIRNIKTDVQAVKDWINLFFPTGMYKNRIIAFINEDGSYPEFWKEEDGKMEMVGYLTQVCVVNGLAVVFVRKDVDGFPALLDNSGTAYELGYVPISGMTYDRISKSIIGCRCRKAESVLGWCLLAPYGEDLKRVLSAGYDGMAKAYFEPFVDDLFYGIVYTGRKECGYIMVAAEFF